MMNHQEAKDLLSTLLPAESLNMVRVEVFRLSWEGKGYNIISEETGYDHDYVRKGGAWLWKTLSEVLECSVTKRNFRPLLEKALAANSEALAHELEYPGGIISFTSPFYIERTEQEKAVYNEVLRDGAVIRIKGPRKMGKSSLALRLLDHVESEGYHIVNIDFTHASSKTLSDLDQLLYWIMTQVISQLRLSIDLDDHWNALIGSKLSTSNLLHDILDDLDRPLLLVIKELNLVYEYEDVSKNFLPLLRSWFEESKHAPAMKKLRQLLIYSTEVYVNLDINLSPFNVGLPIELKGFDGDQLESLANIYGYRWKNDGKATSPITMLLSSLGGHPYLCQLALYSMASSSEIIESPTQSLKQLLSNASKPGGVFSHFLQLILVDLNNNQSAMSALRKLESAQEPLTRVEMYQLERLGVINIIEGEPQIVNQMIYKYLLSNI
ncbi:hypothetical protein JCM19241_3711 [Vibrio ishigakensis]|uniref:vWA-MoxR associated protein N-terminal HTH domain-containing protein n=2 Tax=Vibrio ishigakensis TaxID=1481914 RepID=A0A0B8QMY4_9VIBR|nr:hypothetical protein JCM19241_3711 [Vibrio ishigakensis]